MKKLLVLMMVLGMASTANAIVLSWSAASITLDVDESTVVGIISDGIEALWDPVWVGATTTLVEITSIVPTPAAGQYAEAIDYTETDPEWWTIQEPYPNPYVVSGKHFDVTIKGLSTGTVTLSIYAFGNDTLPITVIPEPTTVVLLALGSLGLLRKRRS